MATLPRHPLETAKAAAAFSIYAHLGPARSLAKVVIEQGKPASYVGQLERWSAQYNWVTRARDWDTATRNEVDDAARRRAQARAERRAAQRERMEDERVGAMRALWRDALAEIQRHLIDQDYRGLVGLVTAMGRGLDEERKALGADTVRVNVTSAEAPMAIAYDPTASEQIRQILRDAAAGLADWRRAHPGSSDDLR